MKWVKTKRMRMIKFNFLVVVHVLDSVLFHRHLIIPYHRFRRRWNKLRLSHSMARPMVIQFHIVYVQTPLEWKNHCARDIQNADCLREKRCFNKTIHFCWFFCIYRLMILPGFERIQIWQRNLAVHSNLVHLSYKKNAFFYYFFDFFSLFSNTWWRNIPYLCRRVSKFV